MSLVWINGQLIDKSDAKISVFDHGFLYGDGAWAQLRAFNGKVFRPETALGFLYQSLSRHLGIQLSQRWDQLLDAIEQTLRANHRTEGYIRVLVTRGVGTLGPDPRKLDPQVIIITEEYQPFPLELYDHGLHATIDQSFFDPGDLFASNLLSPRYLVQAKQTALRAGCLEAVLLIRDQAIRAIEGALFFVRSGELHQLSGVYDVLPGVVIELARQLAIPFEINLGVTVCSSKFDEFRASDEIFIAGTACGIIGIISIGGKPIGTGREGPITKRIREAYHKLTRGVE
jgi:branched-chain amino acid aminotransferase